MSVVKDGSILLFFQSSNWANDYINSNPHTYWAIKIDKNKNIEFIKQYTKGHALYNRKQFENSRGNITQSLGGSVLEIDTSSKIIWYRNLSEGIYNPKSMIETKDHAMIVVGKNKPGELTFQNYTVSPIVLPEFSEKFSVETSQPKFTQDTVWLGLKFVALDLNTIVTNIFCNEGSIAGKIENYYFASINGRGNQIREVIHDGEYLEPGECADIRIRNYTDIRGVQYQTLYFSKPIQPLVGDGKLLTIGVDVTNYALWFDYNQIDFDETKQYDTSDVVYIESKNITSSDVILTIEKGNGSNCSVSIDTVLTPNTSVEIPILFTPNDTGRIEEVIKFKYRLTEGAYKREHSLTVSGYSIPPKQTSVIETNEQPQIIYPNPATNSINLSGYAEELIYIFDITGKQMGVTAVESDQVDISNLTTGIYLLKDINGKVVGKFVKE